VVTIDRERNMERLHLCDAIMEILDIDVDLALFLFLSLPCFILKERGRWVMPREVEPGA